MIKTSWKKSLVIAGVLTALCASAAFAAEQTAPAKPSMRDRVDTILHDDSHPGRMPGHWRGPMHPGPQLTEDQAKTREARRAEWENMTPEERQAAHAKWREERVKNMTHEEKERFEQREKQREEWRKMTPEERQKAREAARAKWDSMSDAEKDAARQHYRSYYHGDKGHYYEGEGHRKMRHHKGEYRGQHRQGYYGDGRTECPTPNCPW